MPRSISEAGSMFFDHFDILPDGRGSDALQEIIRNFSCIPWENLTKFIVKSQIREGSSRIRPPGTVMREHIDNGAGGTCFSLTAVLGSILESAGYHCRPVMADMNHGPNIHCGLLIEGSDDDEYLADPGYLVPVAVPVNRGESLSISLGVRELVWEPEDDGNTFNMYSMENGVKQWRYRVHLAHVAPSEFRMHWERSFDSVGMNGLHLNRLTESGRLSAHNMNLRLVSSGKKRNEKLRDDYPQRIQEYFGLKQTLVQAALDEWRKSCQDR